MKAILGLLLLASSSAFAQGPLLVDLSGEWRRSPDDRPQYADPAFDDSTWALTRLPYTSVQYRSAATYWLRKSVELPPGTGGSKATLTIGPVREIYEAYLNGQKIGETGPFADDSRAQIARTRIFAVPSAALEGRARVTIALRTRGIYFGSTASYIHLGGSYLLSDAARAPTWEAKAMTDRQRLLYSPRMLLSGLLLCLSLLTFVLWMVEQERREVLWIAVLTACRGVNDAFLFSHTSPEAFPLGGPLRWLFAASVAGILISLMELALTTARWRSLRLRIPLWIMAVVTVYAGPDGLGALAADSVVLLILAAGWWLGRFRQPWWWSVMALILALLAAVQLNALGGLRLMGSTVSVLPVFYPAGSMLVSLQSTIFLVLGTILFLLSLGRLIEDRVQKQRLAGELEAARVVQQLLLESESPEDGAGSGNWIIDACYLPAAEVGGDFYQIFPLPDGSHQLAAGDVSGKGLKAAMVVSLITGALRNRRSDHPSDLLAELNRVLAGSLGGGFVTAVIACFHDDGRVVAASAGHPSPYLGGEELGLDAGLPLGLSPVGDYPEREAHLEPGQQLTFVSDGVIEAESAERELFGFERTREISTQPAGEIAEAARAWGQNDDITAVTVRRTDA